MDFSSFLTHPHNPNKEIDNINKSIIINFVNEFNNILILCIIGLLFAYTYFFISFDLIFKYVYYNLNLDLLLVMIILSIILFLRVSSFKIKFIFGFLIISLSSIILYLLFPNNLNNIIPLFVGLIALLSAMISFLSNQKNFRDEHENNKENLFIQLKYHEINDYLYELNSLFLEINYVYNDLKKLYNNDYSYKENNILNPKYYLSIHFMRLASSSKFLKISSEINNSINKIFDATINIEIEKNLPEFNQNIENYLNPKDTFLTKNIYLNHLKMIKMETIKSPLLEYQLRGFEYFKYGEEELYNHLKECSDYISYIEPEIILKEELKK